MADFDTTLVNADLAAICSVTYGGPQGAFYYGGNTSVTYYGVFNQTNAQVVMVPNGFEDDTELVLMFPRTTLTPSVNITVYRIFDSTPYRILTAKPDEMGWECFIARPR